ncbi:ferredoxin-type protein NapF [Aestuariirhabdus sp. LZHN29]|uniref:ferredoxin-type protein NapF n=1 Tax=Aestuariirhabdus sp. LZHN29 TaxID=3417462 RepID=UPI003CFAB69F
MSAAVDQGKRALLRGSRATVVAPLRPPWSRPEALFTELCTRCGDCVAECETGILVKGDGGYPSLDFSRGECTFCQGCLSQCETGALDAGISPPWSLKASILPQCLTHQQVVCRSCADPCETRAIQFTPIKGGVATPQIDTGLCTGCGACFNVCPSHAIKLSAAPQPSTNL